MKKTHLLISPILICCIAMSCASSMHSKSVRNDAASYSSFEKVGYYDENPEQKQKQKVIYNSYITLAVTEPDSVGAKLESISKKYNGYITENGTYMVIIRVESEKLNQAADDITHLGKVLNKSVSGNDVTEDYLDYQIRLENAQKARGRYLELLERAENVEAALLVEKELERLNETIELLKGKLSNIDHLTKYSTITITLKKNKKPGILGYVGLGLYHTVKWLFVRN